ncbi:MAG: 4-hydroxythreonine-4-phosphate dehydrogenase PdxA [Bryobacteraceae bacterium]
MKPRIGLLLGDPSGIGPELIAKLLSSRETRAQAEILVIGDQRLLSAPSCPVASTARQSSEPDSPVPIFDWRLSDPSEYPLATASAVSGAYVLSVLRLAAEVIQRKEIDALVYAPLNKAAMKMAGMHEEDEMHFMATRLGYTGYMSEINVCDALCTTRVTSHVPISAVAGLITRERILDATRLINRTLIANGNPTPRIAVAGLNPHAGEGGQMGTEEITTIGPAVQQAKSEGITVDGPFPADTVFIAARNGRFDAVVTMYHDQGQIATKLLGFERGVTIHGGLPLPITTPAHGTAFDIAGKGIASVSAMQAAFATAARSAC